MSKNLNAYRARVLSEKKGSSFHQWIYEGVLCRINLSAWEGNRHTEIICHKHGLPNWLAQRLKEDGFKITYPSRKILRKQTALIYW